jgi:uncharacterized membrane protein
MREESGVVAIVMALVTCFVLIPLAALAVDIGMQRVARRDMQSLADVAALDLARHLDGRQVKDYDFGVLRATARKSVCNNRSNVGDLGGSQVCNGSAVDKNADISFELGTTDPAKYGGAGYFTPIVDQDGTLRSGFTNTVAPTAVRVTTWTDVGFGLANALPGGGVTHGGTARSAIATTTATTCFKLGSYAAAVKSDGASVLAPLNDIFGLNLQVVGYQGLADAQLTLADLAANPRIGGVDALLSGGVSMSNLVQAMVDVLNKQNPKNTVAITALGSVLAVAGTMPNVKLADVIKVAADDNAALNTQFSVLDLLAGAVLVADGEHAVAIPNLWANVAGTGNTKISDLSIIQKASMACGAPNSADAQANQAQLKGTVTFDQMNSPSINLGFANLKTGIATGILDVKLASAHGALVSPPNPQCKSGTLADPDTFTVNVSSTLASLTLTSQLPVTGSVKIPLLGLTAVDLNLIVDITVSNVQQPGTTPANLRVPPNDTTPISTGSPTRLNMAQVSVTIDPASTAKLLGLDVIGNPLLAPTLNGVLAAVSDVFVSKTISPLVANINSLLTGPLAELLGLDVGGADVYAVGRPKCAEPKLAG